MTGPLDTTIAIPPPEPPPPPRRPRVAAPAVEPAWNLPAGLADLAVSGGALLAEADAQVECVVEGLLEPTDVCLFSGEEKTALKTWQLLELAVARILGGQWLGRQVKCGKPGRVLFISTETSRRNIGRRLKAICRGLGVDPRRVAEHLVVVDQPITILPREFLDRARRKSTVANAVASIKLHDKERREALDRNVEAIADGEAKRLGRNLDALEAILDSPKGTWSLVCIDTVRQTLEGDENSSADASRYTQGCRELGRALACPVVASHHTSKGGTAGDARSSRGSVELTAGPDALCTVGTSGEYPTVHSRLRNLESPGPVGYRLAVDPNGGAKLEILPPCGKANAVADDDVLAVLRTHADTGLSVTKIRTLVSAAKGGKPGAKANPKVIEGKLTALEAKGLISRCHIQQRNGETFDGWRIGTGGGVVEAKPIQRTLAEAMEDPDDV